MKLSEIIAERLFTNGAGHKAQRLVLEMENGSDGGGWCKKTVIDQIDRILTELTNQQEQAGKCPDCGVEKGEHHLYHCPEIGFNL